MDSHYKIDKLDKQIVAMLMEDARIPYTEIAKKLIISPGTVHVRMRKLEEMGLVKGSSLIIDPSKAGFDMVAFIGVNLEKGGVYRQVLEQLKDITEVVEAYYTTGQYGMFLKVVCKNTQHMREVLNEKIQVIDGIHGTETFLSLEESLKRQVQLF